MSIFLNADQSLDKPVSGRGSRAPREAFPLPKIGFWTVEQHPRIVLAGMSGFFHSLDECRGNFFKWCVWIVLQNTRDLLVPKCH